MIDFFKRKVQQQMSAQVIGGIVRALLAAVGGTGLVSDSDISQAAGALSVLAVIAWSAYQKHAADAAKRESKPQN